jgi:hypothetical protein
MNAPVDISNVRVVQFPVNEDEALERFRRQRGKPNLAQLARDWGWSRSKVRRHVQSWNKNGKIACRDQPNCRAPTPTTSVMTIPAPVATVTPAGPAGIARPTLAENTVNAAAFLAASALASVSAYFSVIGLVAIFAASFWPVVAMGGALEAGKLVTAAWLYRNWRSTPWLLKGPLTVTIVVLMAITSIGVFGYLSKAHIDHQVEGLLLDADKIATIDGQIDVQGQLLADLDRRISQIDAAIEQATERGRSNAAMAIAERQRHTRLELSAIRQREATMLAALRAQKMLSEARRKRVEAEVGPIRYLAQLVGEGDLEKAVRGLILAIVSVFDPMAVLLMIAATGSRRPGRIL